MAIKTNPAIPAELINFDHLPDTSYILRHRPLPAELINFDHLPDTAHVRLPVVCGLYGCSDSTVWRNVRAGLIPAPIKLTPNVAAWNVGRLRSALAARAAV